MSKYEGQYKKEIRRIKSFISRAEKRGYSFPDGVIPKKPEKITAGSIRKLKKITPDSLYKKAEYGGFATYGEIVSGIKGRKEERKQAAQKAANTRKERKSTDSERYNPSYEGSLFDKTVLANYSSHVRQFNHYVGDYLVNWLFAMIDEQGEHNVAIMLQKGAENSVIVTRQVIYGKDGYIQYIASMLDYLPEAGYFTKKRIMDELPQYIEYEEDW